MYAQINEGHGHVVEILLWMVKIRCFDSQYKGERVKDGNLNLCGNIFLQYDADYLFVS